MLGDTGRLGYVLTLLSFDIISLSPPKEQKGGEVEYENTPADPSRTNVANVVPPVPQGPPLGTGDGTRVGGMADGANDPPPLPPTIGGNEHSNHKAVGCGTTERDAAGSKEKPEVRLNPLIQHNNILTGGKEQKAEGARHRRQGKEVEAAPSTRHQSKVSILPHFRA